MTEVKIIIEGLCIKNLGNLGMQFDGKDNDKFRVSSYKCFWSQAINFRFVASFFVGESITLRKEEGGCTKCEENEAHFP